METLTRIFWVTGTVVGITVMLGHVISTVDYIWLSFTARGSVKQIEEREDFLSGTAFLAGVFIIVALVHFIGMETIHSVIRQITLFVGLLGLCIGAAQIVRAGFILLIYRGRSERIAEAKSILWRAVWGMPILAGILIFIVRKL